VIKEDVLDANAVIAYFQTNQSENAARVDHLVDLAELGRTHLLISAINLGEIFYNLRKLNKEEIVLRLMAKLTAFVTVIEIDAATAIQAAELKYRYKLGYADSFAALLAIERKATLVSADPDFEKVGKSLKWLRLSPFRAKP